MKAAPKRIEIKELPEGWIEINLNAVVESMKNGLYKPASEYAEHGVACLRMYNIDRGRIIWKNIKRMLLTSDEVNEYQLAPDDLLVNRVNSRELVGKTAVFPKGLEPCVYESKNIRVRLLSELVNSDFVSYQLLLLGQNHFNYNSQQVVGMASISQPQIGDFPLLVPPRIEQDRIVSKVQAMLARLAKSSSHIANVAKTLKRFRQAVLAAACSGRLTEDWREAQKHLEPAKLLYERIQELRAERHRKGTADAIREGRRKPNDPRNSEKSAKPVIELPELPAEWGLHTLQDLSYLITDGTHRTPKYRENGVAFLSVKNVRPFRILDGDVKRISPEEHAEISGRCNPEVGDILYTKVGTFGNAAVNRLTYPFSLFVSVALIKPVQECFTPEYAGIVLNSSFVFAQAVDRVSGSGVPDLHLLEIRDFRIPLPSVAEQNEIVRRVRNLFRFADSVEQRLATTIRRVDKLNQSILAKAFRGELVPTEAELARREGREYEPASMLLERIKKERNSVTPSTATRQRTRSNGKRTSEKGQA